MKDFIKKNVRYYLGVLLGFQTCLFGIAGMQYLGYSFAIGFNSILSGIVIGLSDYRVFNHGLQLTWLFPPPQVATASF